MVKKMIQSKLDIQVDLENINMKVIVTNTDLIKSIIELSINRKKYSIKGSPTSILFWSNVFNEDAYFNIFKRYKPDTIRKYWNLIQKNCAIPKVIEILNEIDSFECCLKTKK